MDLTIALASALPLLLVGLGAYAWLRQQRRLNQLAALLAATEGSRRAMAEQLVSLHQQLDAKPDRGSDNAAERRRALEQLLNDLHEPGTDSSWAETQPISVPPEGFASTLPSRFSELPVR